MAVKHPDCAFLFVVDTDAYSGNFEREMCGYMTGQFGECGVGDEEAQLFEEEVSDEINFSEIIQHIPDENGCHRPATIWPTPGWFNNGMGGHFKDQDDQEEPALKHRNEQYDKEADKNVYHNESANAAHRARWLERKEEPLQKHPAYLSVAICFNDRPTDEQIEILRERARRFSEIYPTRRSWNKKFTITGFRLIQVERHADTVGSWDA